MGEELLIEATKAAEADNQNINDEGVLERYKLLFLVDEQHQLEEAIEKIPALLPTDRAEALDVEQVKDISGFKENNTRDALLELYDHGNGLIGRTGTGSGSGDLGRFKYYRLSPD